MPHHQSYSLSPGYYSYVYCGLLIPPADAPPNFHSSHSAPKLWDACESETKA